VLREIYIETLTRCAPDLLVQRVSRDDFPRNVVAIGKCAGALRDGIECDDAFVAIPEGYRPPRKPARVAIGTHPNYSEASFEAGRQLLEFVDAHDDITFIISGGGSACVEVPLREDAIEENARLIASGLPIGAINAKRREMSAIKGGKLAARVRGRCVTLVYSDVSRGALADVASGPTIPGSDEVILIADNDTLTATAAAIANERDSTSSVGRTRSNATSRKRRNVWRRRLSTASSSPAASRLLRSEETARAGGAASWRCVTSLPAERRTRSLPAAMDATAIAVWPALKSSPGPQQIVTRSKRRWSVPIRFRPPPGSAARL
jgi:hypothetical protein